MVQTSLNSNAALILDKATIERKMLRMAYEIYENNTEEQEIILAGISDRGTTVAYALQSKLKKITPFQMTIVKIEIDKKKPLNATLKGNPDCTAKCVIIIDDVANSGRTLFYGMRPFMDMLHKKIQIAVLVDRMHKSYPISVDYTGCRLSTTLQERVIVDLTDDKIQGAYLS